MTKSWRLLPLLILSAVVALAGCSPDQEGNEPSPSLPVAVDQATDIATSTLKPSATDTVEPTAALDPGSPEETATTEMKMTNTPLPATETSEPPPTVSTQLTFHDLSLDADDIFLFPVPELFAGDPVSIQVMPSIPRGLAPNDVDVRILVDGQELVTGNLNWRKLSGDTVGLYQWVWDTTGLAGEHTLTAIMDPLDLIHIGDEDPENNQATITVDVQPASAFSELEAAASWITAETQCCIVHIVTGTAAERDIEDLLLLVDEAFAQVSRKLDVPLSEPYHVYLVDKVIGQGGYAIDKMVASYLDRNYAGGGLYVLLAHEATHLIDQQLTHNQITFLSEGIAVWAAGGHYQQQDLGQRMAALIELGRYVPIAEVINNFFATQHEISYLEGGSLIDYLVNTYGWPLVSRFYSETSADDGFTLAEAVSANTQIYFGRTLEQVEADWMDYLRFLPRDRQASQDLETMIRYYDVMRRYQIAYDPTAYYLYAWLPSPDQAELRQATADFTRHPESDVNIALEAMLLAANQAWIQGNLGQSNALLDSVDRVIDSGGQFVDPLAKSYWNIVNTATELGYEVQQMNVSGNQASAMVTRPDELAIIHLQLVLENDQDWILAR